jgi:hypothetical protein
MWKWQKKTSKKQLRWVHKVIGVMVRGLISNTLAVKGLLVGQLLEEYYMKLM